MDRNLSEAIAHCAQDVINRAREMGVKIICAESCTCGSLPHALCVPGASDVLAGSFVCYTNEMKIHLLGVDPETIRQHTEVSEECAREMAVCAYRKVRSIHSWWPSLALATTGFVGPYHGSPARHAYVGVRASWLPTAAYRVEFTEDNRARNTQLVVQEALKRARDALALA